jgi:molybdopterin-biosynthesis enzyme MoeA-like protein
VRNPQAEKILREYYGERLNAERLNMADLPEGCELVTNTVTKAPGIKIKNIYVFAGVPKILRAMWDQVESEISGTPIFEVDCRLKVGEGDVAHHMKTVINEYPLVELGSYPNLEPDERGYRTQIVMRSQSKQLAEAALARFLQLCGENT